MKGIRKANVRESNSILIILILYMYVIRKNGSFSEFELGLNWFNNIWS